MSNLTLKSGRHALHDRVVELLDGQGIEASDIKRFRTARFSDNPTHIVIGTLFGAAPPETFDDTDIELHYFIQGLARYKDEASEEAADDALDDMQHILLTNLPEHTAADEWETLDIVGRPPRTARKIGSHNYKIFEIRVKLEN